MVNRLLTDRAGSPLVCRARQLLRYSGVGIAAVAGSSFLAACGGTTVAATAVTTAGAAVARAASSGPAAS